MEFEFEDILKVLKKYRGYIIAGVIVIVLLLTFGYRVNVVDKKAEDKLKIVEKQLKEKEFQIEKLTEENDSLENEVERQKMMSSEWYEMWLAERYSSEWLWDFYYKNVCSLNDEKCPSGVYE